MEGDGVDGGADDRHRGHHQLADEDRPGAEGQAAGVVDDGVADDDPAPEVVDVAKVVHGALVVNHALVIDLAVVDQVAVVVDVGKVADGSLLGVVDRLKDVDGADVVNGVAGIVVNDAVIVERAALRIVAVDIHLAIVVHPPPFPGVGSLYGPMMYVP
jgi:hypothetical protein